MEHEVQAVGILPGDLLQDVPGSLIDLPELGGPGELDVFDPNRARGSCGKPPHVWIDLSPRMIGEQDDLVVMASLHGLCDGTDPDLAFFCRRPQVGEAYPGHEDLRLAHDPQHTRTFMVAQRSFRPVAPQFSSASLRSPAGARACRVRVDEITRPLFARRIRAGIRFAGEGGRVPHSLRRKKRL